MSELSRFSTPSLGLTLLAGTLAGVLATPAIATGTLPEDRTDAIASPEHPLLSSSFPLQDKDTQENQTRTEPLLRDESANIRERTDAAKPIITFPSRPLTEPSSLPHLESAPFQKSVRATQKESTPSLTSQIPLPVIPAPQPIPQPPPSFDPNTPPPLSPAPSPATPFIIDPSIPQTFGPENPIPPRGYSPPTFEFDNLPPTPDSDDRFSRYRLGIGDNISVRVENFPEFDVQGVINLEGNLVVPILGNVPLIGLTLEEVSAKISTALGQQYLLEEPEVTTVLANPRPATITVLGEVVRPGFYNLVPGAEVDEAIVAAQGSTTLADLRQVIVRRSLADGTVLEREVNIFESLQNGTRLPLLRLQDGDSVFVPQLEVGRDADYDRRLVAESTIAQPQITVRVLSYPNEAIGAIALANGSTFVDAISQIGLSFQEADLDSIGLLRFDPEQGRIVSQSLNALAAIEGDFSQNVPLQDEDILVVRRSTFAKIDYILRTVSRPINSVVNLFNFIRNTLIDTIPNLIR